RRAGMTLRRVGEGWRLYTRDEHAPVVERWLVDGQRSRLTQAALETLAVIAYRQPVTRSRISAIRGVGVDGVMRTLLARGLVHEVGPDPDSGGGLYATTPLFLERLGLTGLDELPELAPLLPETSTMLDEHPDS
ncbi:MAG: SMC-Scp complex subunit ScpB, partial [Nocardioides sp.]